MWMWMWMACDQPDPALEAQRGALAAFEVAQRQLEAGQGGQARLTFTMAGEAFPHPALTAWEAKAAADAGDLEAAVTLLQAALAEDPSMEAARYNLAAYLARLDRPAASGPELQRALADGAADPFDAITDPDFQAHRSHPAFAFLPASALSATVQETSPVTFVGSDVTLGISLSGIVGAPITLAAPEAIGPVRLTGVVEDHRPGGGVDLTWTFEVLGPGTIDFGPLEIRAGVHSATAAPAPIEASAPPGVRAPQLPQPILPVPTTVAKGVVSGGRRIGDRLEVPAGPRDTVLLLPPHKGRSMRLLRRDVGQDTSVLHVYEDVDRVSKVVVVRPDGTTAWQGAPLVVPTEPRR